MPMAALTVGAAAVMAATDLVRDPAAPLAPNGRPMASSRWPLALSLVGNALALGYLWLCLELCIHVQRHPEASIVGGYLLCLGTPVALAIVFICLGLVAHGWWRAALWLALLTVTVAALLFSRALARLGAWLA